MRKKVFVSAYACEPNSGSEIAVGWNWILQMSHFLDVWVLTRSSNRSEIEYFLANTNNPDYKKIKFVFYDLPKSLRFWKKQRRGVRLYYNLWQLLSNKLVKKTMIDNHIDTFHHITYGNALWLVSPYGLKQKFVWGPIGGLECISNEYSKHYPFRSRLLEKIRRFAVNVSFFNIGLRRRIKNADLIICKTQDTMRIINRYKPEKTIIKQCTDVAVNCIETHPYKKNNEDSIRFIAVGHLDCWRGFDLLIEAFAKAYEINSNIRLTILGDGANLTWLKRLIKEYALDDMIKMKGNVSRVEYNNYLYEHDALINTSLKEGAVTVSFDAIKYSKPFICFESGGYTKIFNDTNSIKLSISPCRISMIKNLSDSIIKLTQEEERLKISQNIDKLKAVVTWDNKKMDIKRLYDMLGL